MPTLSRFLPPGLRAGARALKRAVRRVALDAPLSPADCRAAVHPLRPVLVLEAGTTAPVPVRLVNLGGRAWASAGRHPVGLTARWLDRRLHPAPGVPDQVFPLPQPLFPGESLDLDLPVTAPAALGHLVLEIAPAQAGGPAFATDRPARIDVQVTGRLLDDIDYTKKYALADLTDDYWTVTGPSTKAEYDRLGPVKLRHLTDLGLTPDGRLLDVGCGTGQLARACAGFFSDRGLYVGTDVGAEGIAFCRERYTRPNFRFEVNEPTRLPLAGVEFDAACFFSVFTHTYPDETALLLAETARLLAPGGWALADLFTSPLVEGCTGNRGAVQVNREHFLRLAGLAGFGTAEVVMAIDWQPPARREFFKLSR